MRNVLTKTLKNRAYEAARQIGLDASEFEWVEVRSEHGAELVVSRLEHRPTGYYFVFDFFREQHWTRRSPAPDKPVDTQYPGSWDSQMGYVREWLRCLKDEIEAPDLWAAVSQEKALVEAASSPTEENRAFTQDELRYIGQQLTEIKEFLFKTQDLSESHRRFVEDRLNYLADAARRVGRVDWKNQLVGVLMGIVFQTALTSDAARELFRFAWTTLGQLFGGTPALP